MIQHMVEEMCHKWRPHRILIIFAVALWSGLYMLTSLSIFLYILRNSLNGKYQKIFIEDCFLFFLTLPFFLFCKTGFLFFWKWNADLLTHIFCHYLCDHHCHKYRKEIEEKRKKKRGEKTNKQTKTLHRFLT